MPRAIDHLVVASRDLDGQAAAYRRLGFQVGARNRHPWGTENHIVQLDGAFLELIALGPGFEEPAPIEGAFSFAGFVARFLRRSEGIAMLALRSENAEADRIAFARAGVGDFARFDFARQARGPDGDPVQVAFSLAYARSPILPDAGFFVCQQHFPENFWSKKAQVHPNGARAIAGLVLRAERPREHAEFLERFVDAPARSAAGGFVIETGGAALEILTPEAIADRYGAEAAAPGLAPLSLVRIAVDDVEATCAHLEKNEIPFIPRHGVAIVAPRDAFGAAIVFQRK